MSRWVALFFALIAAFFVAAGAVVYHVQRQPPAPNPGGDLDVPVLVSRGGLDYEHLLADERPGVPILCYHYFSPGLTPERFGRVLGAVVLNLPSLPDRDYWTTTAPEFERQMAHLKREGWRTAFLEDVLAAFARGESLEKTAVLTIDDGDRTFVEYAVPILREYGFNATLFLLSGRAGETNWNELDFVTWEEVRDLEAEGVVRVESHTHRMHTKVATSRGPVPRVLMAATRDPAQLTHDLQTSRDVIFRELGREPRYLAWPFGYGRADIDSIAGSVGFEAVLTLEPYRNAPRGERIPSLGRYAVNARTSLRMFRLMLEAASS